MNDNLQNKRIAIIGSGAAGIVIGGLVFNKGCDVILAGRRSHVEEINKNGSFCALNDLKRKFLKDRGL